MILQGLTVPVELALQHQRIRWHLNGCTYRQSGYTHQAIGDKSPMDIHHLNNILASKNIKGTCIKAEAHRHLAFYDIKLAPSGNVNKIRSSVDEIAMALKTKTVPIVKVIPELGIVRLQVAIRDADTLPISDMMKDVILPDSYLLPFVLGENDEGKRVIVDMAKNPHLLVAGGTGSGKSVFLHTLIANAISLSASEKRNIQLFLIDPKRVEFNDYDRKDLKRYVPIVSNDYMSACVTMELVHKLMESRYEMMADLGVKSIEENPHLFPSIMVIMDEVGDLILQDNSMPLGQKGKFQHLISLITQKARAAGIYLVAATQHPSREIIRGAIKTNFPARVACRVGSRAASQIVLDATGAENLLGRGDAILKDARTDSERFQVAFTDPKEIIISALN